MGSELVAKAVQIALEAHAGQMDRAGLPYVGHALRVMAAGHTDDEKIVGVLHDVVEDTPWTFEDLLAEGFPEHIVDALRCVTKGEGEPYDVYIGRVSENPLATAVKLKDLTDNMDVRRMQELTEKEVERLRKYLKAYKRLAEGR